jgi:hypothetical protein
MNTEDFIEEVASDWAHAVEPGFGDLDEEIKRFRDTFYDEFGRYPDGDETDMFIDAYNDIQMDRPGSHEHLRDPLH